MATGNTYRFTTAGGNEWSLLPYTAATDTINGGGVGAEWRVDATTRFISCVAVSMTAWSCSASPLNPAANQVGVYTTIPNASATGNPPTTVWNALTVTATASAPNYDYVQLPPAVQGQQYFFLISPTNTNLWTIHPASGGRVNKAGVDVPLFVPLSSTFVHCVAIVSAPGGHWSCEGVEEDTIYTELQQWSFVNKATTADPGTPITTSLTLLNVIAATSFVRLPALIVGAEYRIVVDTVPAAGPWSIQTSPVNGQINGVAAPFVVPASVNSVLCQAQGTVALGWICTLQDSNAYHNTMRLVTADSTELNYLDTALPGTAVLNKAAVLGPAKNLDVLQLNANIATSSISMRCLQLVSIPSANLSPSSLSLPLVLLSCCLISPPLLIWVLNIA